MGNLQLVVALIFGLVLINLAQNKAHSSQTLTKKCPQSRQWSVSILRATLSSFERKQRGGFRKRAVLANIPSFRFWYRGYSTCILVPVFGSMGTSECTLVPVFGTGEREHPPKPHFDSGVKQF